MAESGLKVEWRDVVLLMFAAFLVRLLWLLLGSWTANDTGDYLTIAANIVDHWSFSLSDGGTPPTAFRPPLFPVMIALIWSVTGTSITALLLANVVLGTLTVGLTYLIARQHFERTIGILAAGALAVAPMTSWFTVTVLTESLFTFLVVLAIYLWGSGRSVSAGLAFGLATLTRPTILPFLLILAVLPLLPAWRPLWRLHLTMAVVAMCVVGIWTIRNVLIVDRFVTVASAGIGVNLLCGTLETDLSGNVWNGVSWVPLDLKTNPVTSVDGEKDEFQIDRIRRDRAVERITSDPMQWITVRAKQYPKLFIDNGDYLLGGANLSLRQAFARGSWGVAVFKVLFITANLLVISLAVVGLWQIRDKLIMTSNIWMFPLFGALIHLPMWIEPRYFLPMMPMVFILAAVALSSLSNNRTIPPR